MIIDKKKNSSGGIGSYIRNTPMSISVGGANVGTTFDGTIADALDKILYPDITPNFLSFTITGVNAVYEVGQLLPSGPKTANWSTSVSFNVKPNSISIIDVTNSNTILANNLPNTGNAIINTPDILYNSQTTHIFRIRGESNSNVVFQRNLEVKWLSRVYFGEHINDTLNQNDVINLRASILKDNVNGSYTFLPLVGGYKWICYPASMGFRTTFIDPNTNFVVAMEPNPLILVITNAFSVSQTYYCYRTFYPLGGAITISVS